MAASLACAARRRRGESLALSPFPKPPPWTPRADSPRNPSEILRSQGNLQRDWGEGSTGCGGPSARAEVKTRKTAHSGFEGDQFVESFVMLSLMSTLVGTAAPLALVGALMGDAPDREALARMAAQSMAVAARAGVDLRYDSISVGAKGEEWAFLGVTVGAPSEMGRPAGCEVRIARVEFGGAALGAEEVSARATLAGIDVDSRCLKPEEMVAFAALGPEALRLDRIELLTNYRLNDSQALVTASLQAPYGAVEIEALADRLHLTRVPAAAPVLAPTPQPEAAPVPPEAAPETGGRRPSVKTPRPTPPEEEFGFDDSETWDDPWSAASGPQTRLDGRLLRGEARVSLSPRLAATLASLAGGADRIGAMVSGGLSAQLRQIGAEGPAAQELSESAARELGRVAANGGSFTVSVAAAEPVALASLAELKGPGAAIAALKPRFTPAPPRLLALLDPKDLAAAVDSPASLSAEKRLEIARAFATGSGAPRSQAAAQKILEPLAEAGNAEAALRLAEITLESGPASLAYRQALAAGAAGESGAQALLDRIEAKLGLAEALKIQGERAAPNPDPLGDRARAGDLGALGGLARAAAEGVGRPRDYLTALTMAEAAAAAGDFGAAALRASLKSRFDSEADSAAWSTLSAESQNAALKLWMDGLGATLRAGGAQP